MVLSEDKESYLVGADAPEAGHASLLLTTTQSAVTQWTPLSGPCLAVETHHVSQRCSCETCMISDHIFHVQWCIIMVAIEAKAAAVHPLFHPPSGINLLCTVPCLVYEPASIYMLITAWDRSNKL